MKTTQTNFVVDTVPPREDSALVREWYQERIRKYGTSLASLGPGPLEREKRRHAVHSAALFGDAPAVLDLGCGIGRFWEFINNSARGCIYTGYDLIPEYIEYCQSVYPTISFYQKDLLKDGIDGEFDTIVSSQVFNNRYAHRNNLEVMEEVLRMTFQHARNSISIDMLSSYVDYQEDHLFYYQPEKILSMAKSITRRVVLRHDYAPFEFCIQMFHDNAPMTAV